MEKQKRLEMLRKGHKKEAKRLDKSYRTARMLLKHGLLEQNYLAVGILNGYDIQSNSVADALRKRQQVMDILGVDKFHYSTWSPYAGRVIFDWSIPSKKYSVISIRYETKPDKIPKSLMKGDCQYKKVTKVEWVLSCDKEAVK